jgi:hypothetical protein
VVESRVESDGSSDLEKDEEKEEDVLEIGEPKTINESEIY